LEAVSDVEIVFEEAFSREILPEHSPGKLPAGKFRAPERIMLGRITVNGFERPSMDAEIGLAVPVEVESPQRHRARDWQLEDPGVDSSALINGEARASDVQGEQFHGIVSSTLPAVFDD